MIGSSKPISSPGRTSTDKFPLPLMRFLRSNAGSRSRGRTRSSPILMRKKNSVSIESTQEPSSPKVTCIGQVRVRRSAAGITRSTSLRKTEKQPGWWVCQPKFVKPKSISSFFHKWAFLSGFGCRKIGDNSVDSPSRMESNPKVLRHEESSGDSGAVAVAGDSASRIKLPIHENKENGIVLARCSSAPYRPTSLAGRFWGSPLSQEFEKMPSSSPRKMEDFENPDEEEKQEVDKVAVHPLLLTRCKSEPSRTVENELTLSKEING